MEEGEVDVSCIGDSEEGEIFINRTEDWDEEEEMEGGGWSYKEESVEEKESSLYIS